MVFDNDIYTCKDFDFTFFSLSPHSLPLCVMLDFRRCPLEIYFLSKSKNWPRPRQRILYTMATSQMQPVAGSPPSSFPGHGFGSRQGDSLSRSSSSSSSPSTPSKWSSAWLKLCQDQLVHPRPLSAHHRQGPRQPLPKVRRVFFFFHQLHWFFALIYMASHIIGPMIGGGREKLLNFWT